jgi:hypothetical protein
MLAPNLTGRLSTRPPLTGLCLALARVSGEPPRPSLRSRIMRLTENCFQGFLMRVISCRLLGFGRVGSR